METNREKIIEQYGNVELKFSSYYKYTFTYVGICEKTGATVSADYGGDFDDIYRFEVDADVTYRLDRLEFDVINVSKNGETLASWDNY